MNTVTFLKEPKDSINREARFKKLKDGRYRVTNLNMPYSGTIAETWTEAELNKKLRNNEIKLSLR